MRILVLAILIGLTALSGAAQTNIRSNNWSAFTYEIGENSIVMKDGLQVGACTEKDEDGNAMGDIWNVEPANIAYGDLDRDGREEAIVPMVANICSGNMITNEVVLVYTVRGGKIVRMPDLAYHDEGCAAGTEGCDFARSPGVGVSYDAKEKAIRVTTYFAKEEDAICCPSLERSIWYKLSSDGFSELKRGKIVPTKR